MGRKRFITSDISDDGDLEDVAKTFPAASLMWPWFLLALDDWARMEADPGRVRNRVFSCVKDHYSREDIARAIELYSLHHLAYHYKVDGKPYLQFNPQTFYRLNSYIKRRNQEHDGSKFPPPRDHPWGRHWHSSDWDDTGKRKSTPDSDE